jgi:hypothetical protein
MLDKITDKLDRERIDDYEVYDKIPSDVIGITGDLKNATIYIPEEMDDELYRIDDFLRREARFLRTRLGVSSDKKKVRTIEIMGTLTLSQYVKLVDFIIDEADFCAIVDIQ